MSRNTNGPDTGHPVSTWFTKYGAADIHPAGGIDSRRPPVSFPASAATSTTTIANSHNSTAGTMPSNMSDNALSPLSTIAAYVDANRHLAAAAATGQRETDAPHRVHANGLELAPAPAAAVRGGAVPFQRVSSSSTIRQETAQSDVAEQASPSPLDMSAASPTTSADPRQTLSRQSMSSEALESDNYHSVGSHGLPVGSADDLPTVEARRQQRLSLPNVELPAVGPATFSAATANTAAAASLPAAQVLIPHSSVPTRVDRSWAVNGMPGQLACVDRGVDRRSRVSQPSHLARGDEAAAAAAGFLSGGSVGGADVSQQGGGSRGITCGSGGCDRVDGGAGAATRSFVRYGGQDGDGGSENNNISFNNHHNSSDSNKDKAQLRERRFCYQPFNDPEPVCATRTASAADWVLLNVGGRLITTTVSTLMADPDSVLASLCTFLSPPLPPPPSPPQLQQQQQQQHLSRRGGSAGESAHRDPAASLPVDSSSNTTTISSELAAMASAAASAHVAAAAGQRRSTGPEGRDAGALTSGGGDAQSLVGEYVNEEPTVNSGAALDAGMAASTSNALDHDAALATELRTDSNTGPVNADSDHSNPSPDPDAHHLARYAGLGFSSQQQQQQQQQRQSQRVTQQQPLSLPSPVAAAAAVTEEEGDGEAVNPQQSVSAVPLDVDRYNSILLDLDADYFLPVLNYLRHGAVMIPQYLNVDGVLAMAEYLNVSGLVQLLRGPPVPRRVLLFSWGSGSNGELGTHAMRDEPTPTMAQVTPFGVRVREIALGANYSCALTDNGHIYTFGNGEWGQLGLGSGPTGGRAGLPGTNGANGSNNLSSNGAAGQDGSGAEVPVELLIPRRIPLFERIPAVHVAAGYAFAMAIVEDYHVYFWGNNNHGQSGRGRGFFDPQTKKVDTPVLVETLEGKRIIQLSCGSFFALALSEDGALYSWGLVDCVGLGTPEEVERRYHAVLGESLSNERRSVVLTPQLVTVKGRRRGGSANNTHGSNGTISNNGSGASERIVRIRAGQWHSGAINEHGELFTWGVGYQGRLGHGSKTPAYVPTLVQGALEGQHVVDVACGSFHTVALTAGGDVFCWGDNASGQCGTTANNPDAFTAPYRVVGLEYVAGGVARSIACGRQHTVVVMEGPQPWCTLPCCQVDAGGRVAHSHAQVYCFGEVSRTGGAAATTTVAAAAAAAVGASGQPRGSVGGPHGMPVSALPASTLSGSPNHSPFAAGGAMTAFLSSSLGSSVFAGGRPTLACTAGHHHPHYQLVTGLQGVDVRAVVSGLHHTFAYVEELMTDDDSNAPRDGGASKQYAFPPTSLSIPGRTRPSTTAYHGGAPVTAVRGYSPSYQAPPLSSSSSVAAGAVRGGVGSSAGVRHPAATPFYLRGVAAGPMQFYPPDWGLGGGGAGVGVGVGGPLPPPSPSVAAAMPSAAAAAATTSSNRRFFVPS